MTPPDNARLAHALALLLTLVGCGPEARGPVAAPREAASSLALGAGGDTSCVWGSPDCNLCIPDVPLRFQELRDHGEVLGFHPGPFHLNVAYPGANHWQGIQRLSMGSGRYLVMSKRDDAPGGSVGHLVHLASRNGEGRRFRSNRLSPAIQEPEDTLPPVTDAAVAALPVLDGYRHGGGMQAVGNILALPMEEGPGPGRVALHDYNQSLTPAPFAFVDGLTANAGTASLTKLSDGHFLLLLGHFDAKALEVFRSTEPDIRSASNQWERVDLWQASELPQGEWGAFQGLNFVTDCNDSRLYLVGTRLGGLRWGAVSDDYAHLYRVHLDGHLRLEHVASKHLYCSNDGSRQCNLDAAGGVFVGSDRSLILYATEHADDGPGSTVKLVEFRGIWADAACRTDVRRAYVDFYDDSDFSDRGVIFDYEDQGLKNWARFSDVDAFNDKASAVRWCIPPGHRVRLHGDSNYKGSAKDLVGDGLPHEVNLNSWGFGDKVSSARWLAL
ncbi:hypothetical protein JYK02_35035 [Corallococcus macrosporus]|uniref:Uncharacterized protein n=1 Tax=Corallococcus macrosporus TaxID=35 RepID=A0ABS3DN36_9BACT|nr:hypothetical protein [Corallococcus macrosporus]MBN8232746.1 hypothetical protein [Corallococcus macrosporus]